MSDAKTIWLLSAGIAVLAAAHFMASSGGAGRPLVQRTSLLGIEAEGAKRIELERAGEAKMVFVLGESGDWRIAEPFQAPAERRSVLRLLDELCLAPVQASYTEGELAKFARGREDYALEEPAVRISVGEGGGAAEVSLGSQTPAGDGTFAAVSGDSSVFVVPTNVLAAATAPAEDFRLRDACPLAAASAESFDLKRGKGVFLRFRRDGDGWRMSGGDGTERAASPVKVREFLSAVGAARAESFVWPTGAEGEDASASPALLAGYGLDPESAATVTLRPRGGEPAQVVFGRGAGEGLAYALVQDAGAVVTLDARTADMAANADFADTRLFPYEAEKVSRVSIADGDDIYLVARDGEGDWRLDAPVSAPADPAGVEALVSRLLSLGSAAGDAKGLMVSFSTNSPAVGVSRAALLSGFQLEDLRSRELARIASGEVRRVAVSAPGAKDVSIAYDRDVSAWVAESPAGGVVDRRAVEALLKALDPLAAAKTVKLKATQDDRRRYGLESPAWTVAVDSAREGSSRRNVLIGEKSQGGRFATIGAADAVFVLSDETVESLTAPLARERPAAGTAP